MDESKEISWDSLLKGRYFFHGTETKRLAPIRKIGLVPPDSHTSGRYWEKLLRNARTDRLFLFTSENDCFFWIEAERILDQTKKFVVLRFERHILGGSKLFFDPLLTPEHETSFSCNCKILPEYLEACVRTNHEKCLEWAPIVP